MNACHLYSAFIIHSLWALYHAATLHIVVIDIFFISIYYLLIIGCCPLRLHEPFRDDYRHTHWIYCLSYATLFIRYITLYAFLPALYDIMMMMIWYCLMIFFDLMILRYAWCLFFFFSAPRSSSAVRCDQFSSSFILPFLSFRPIDESFISPSTSPSSSLLLFTREASPPSLLSFAFM